MTPPTAENSSSTPPPQIDWRTAPPHERHYAPVPPRPAVKSLVLAGFLFLLAFCTCLAAGTQFAAAYQQNQAVSMDEWLRAFTLFYKNPAELVAGLPFALTLLGILLAHELGHFFACRHHHIRSSYPFFIPFPSLIGTFGAFILIRSPIRTRRALFDVGASGPLVGFVLAVPALIYGVLHSKFVPGLADPKQAEIIYGNPLLLHILDTILRPGISPDALLLPPIGRAAWVGLFATSLNLMPVAQLDGGHILRSVNPRLHRRASLIIPIVLFLVGISGFWNARLWNVWSFWGVLLLLMSFLRVAPIHDPATLDSKRRWGAFLALLVFLLSFMPAPFFIPPSSP